MKRNDVRNIKSKIIVLILLIITLIMILSGCQAQEFSAGYDRLIMEQAEAKKQDILDLASSMLVTIGGIAIFLSVLLTGFKMILQSKNPTARSESMSALSYVLIGIIILGTLSLTTGLVMSYTESIAPNWATGPVQEQQNPENPDVRMEEDRGNFLTMAISGLLTLIINFVRFIEDTISGGQFKGVIRMIFEEAVTLEHAPFTNSEWIFLNQLYGATTAVVGTFVLLMVGKTGLSSIAYSHSPQKREKVLGDVQRWFLMGIFLALAPILVTALTKLFNTIILLMYSTMANAAILDDLMGSNMIENIKTSSTFTTKVAQALYLGTELRIIVIFAVRKVVLTIMYAFTPIAIAIWGLSDRSYASAVWFGEMISNLTMSLFYSFTMFIMIGALNSSNMVTNWFSVIIWMMSIIPVAKVLRNSLQGLFVMMAGIDEEGLAGSAVGTVGNFLGTSGAMVAGVGGALASTFKGRNFKDPQNIFNKATGSTASPESGSTGVEAGPSTNASVNTGASNVSGTSASANGADSSTIGKESLKDAQSQYANYDDYMNSFNGAGGPSDNSNTIGDSTAPNPATAVDSTTSEEKIPARATTANKYSQMLVDKYQNMINSKGYKRYNTAKGIAKAAVMTGGAFAGNAAQMVFGNDSSFGYAVNNMRSLGRGATYAAGQAIDKGVNVRLAGKAIHETVGDIKDQEPGISYKDAINKIFDQDSNDPYRMERVKVIGDLINTRVAANPPRGKILYSANPYTSIDGMNYKS